jgi:hypothetical protein
VGREVPSRSRRRAFLLSSSTGARSASSTTSGSRPVRATSARRDPGYPFARGSSCPDQPDSADVAVDGGGAGAGERAGGPPVLRPSRCRARRPGGLRLAGAHEVRRPVGRARAVLRDPHPLLQRLRAGLVARLGVRHVVLAAAGLDTRAFRLDWRSATWVYEIELPRTNVPERWPVTALRPT